RSRLDAVVEECRGSRMDYDRAFTGGGALDLVCNSAAHAGPFEQGRRGGLFDDVKIRWGGGRLRRRRVFLLLLLSLNVQITHPQRGVIAIPIENLLHHVCLAIRAKGNGVRRKRVSRGKIGIAHGRSTIGINEPERAAERFDSTISGHSEERS